MPREAFDGKLFVNLWTLHMRDSHRLSHTEIDLSLKA